MSKDIIKDIIEVNEETRFLFLMIMQGAIKARELEMSKGVFLVFCKGIWESMLSNGKDELKQAIHEVMISDLKKYADKID